MQKKYDAADDAWRMARDRAKAKVSANPKDARSQYYLGAARVRLKDPSGPYGASKAAATQGFDPRMVNLQLGLTHMLDKDWNAAKTALDAVIEADNRFAPAYFLPRDRLVQAGTQRQDGRGSRGVPAARSHIA